MKYEIKLTPKQLGEIEAIFSDIKLTEQEKRYLSWLWQWDTEAIDTFISIFKKLKQRQNP